jgi:hypothetical protein
MPEETQETDQKPAAADEQQFIATARERFKQAWDDEQALRAEAEEDFRYEAGDQWDEAVKAQREAAGRPFETFNRMHTYVQLVSNEARQNRIQIKFTPQENGDRDTADVYEGIGRQIQYNSQARVATETAVEHAAAGGFGYFRYLTKFCNEGREALENPERAWDQELEVVPVYNPFAIYGVLIPTCLGIEPRHAFAVEYMTREEYELEYPKSKLASMDWDEAQELCGDWAEDKVRIAEYWYIEETPEKVKSKDGKRERTVMKRQVMFAKINGVEVLERTPWLGTCIPIWAVLGKLRFLKGKPILFSVIRFQRSPQRLLNVYKSRIAETLMTSPINPFMVPDGAIPPEDVPYWETMNTDPRPFLRYKAYDAQNRLIPPPVQNTIEPPIQAYSHAAAQEIDEMKAAAGIYDASQGARSNETSGKAIQKREQQASLTNLHFLDNLERSQERAGREMAYLIPKIYDTERMVRILGEDETPKVVKINAPWQESPNARPKLYKVGGKDVGKYDVVVTMGRAFSSKRMESFDMYTQLGQTNPEIAFATSDLMLRNSDMAGANEAAERMKKLIMGKFPFLQEEQDASPEQQAQMLQVKMGEMQTQLEALNQYAAEKDAELEDLNRKLDAKVIENNTRLEIEKLKIQAQITIAEITAKSQDLRERLKWEGEMARDLEVQAADAQARQDAQLHEAAMADASHRAGEQAAAAAAEREQMTMPPEGEAPIE